MLQQLSLDLEFKTVHDLAMEIEKVYMYNHLNQSCRAGNPCWFSTATSLIGHRFVATRPNYFLVKMFLSYCERTTAV